MSFPGSIPETPDAWIERNPYDEPQDPDAYEVCPVCDRIACACEDEYPPKLLTVGEVREQLKGSPPIDEALVNAAIEEAVNIASTQPEVSNLRCTICGKTSDARTFDEAAKWIGRHECADGKGI